MEANRQNAHTTIKMKGSLLSKSRKRNYLNGNPLKSMRVEGIITFISLILPLLLLACQSEEVTLLPAGSQDPQESLTTQESQGPMQTTNAVQPVKPTELDEAQLLQQQWAESPHADTFVVGEDGKNNTCARCHAPINWIPTMEDMPESCSTCKFEVDPPPPLIPETEWTNIECKVCHKVKKDKVEAQYTWLEIAPIEEYAEVNSTTELCDKFHLAGDIPGHVSVVVGGDHPDYTCTQCHNAHDATASCTAAA